MASAAADWALFAKNGCDVTSLTLLIAKAATGRQKIVLISHGVTPWAQGTVLQNRPAFLICEGTAAPILTYFL